MSRQFDCWIDDNLAPVVQPGALGTFETWGADDLFPIVQPTASALARRFTLPVEFHGLISLRRSASIPVEFGQSHRRVWLLPVEWQGQGRRAVLPVEFLSSLAARRLLPVEWPVEFGTPLRLSRRLPFESAGLDPDSLTLIWNVVRLLDQPLLLSWDVVTFAAQFPLEVRWAVIEAIVALELRWNDLPDVFTPFGITPPSGGVGTIGSGQLTSGTTDGDIQKPVAVLDKTP